MFIPGYLGVCCFQFATARKYQVNTQVVAGCVCSYILLGICNLIAQRFPQNIALAEWPTQSVISTSLAILLGFIFAYIIKAKWFISIFVKNFGVSASVDLMESVLDKDGGTNIRVYFKNKPGYHIYGHYDGRDITGKDDWIYISGYMHCFDDGTESEPMPDDVGYLCRLSDIDHFVVE